MFSHFNMISCFNFYILALSICQSALQPVAHPIFSFFKFFYINAYRSIYFTIKFFLVFIFIFSLFIAHIFNLMNVF